MSERPSFDGIHHLKFPVADCDRSLKFYEDVFGARRIAQADHRDADGVIYAYICEVPGLGTSLDLRLSKFHAEGSVRLDPITLNIESRAALAEWVAHLDRLGVPHSGEIPTAFAYMLVIEDPDGRFIRLYTKEKKAADVPSSHKTNPWMQLTV